MIISVKVKSLISNSEKETEEFAAKIAQGLKAPAVVTLSGDLGAGKTVFSRGFARALGVVGPISSPTFTIVQEYDIDNGLLYHMDLYRISDDEEALSFGIEEYINDSQSICLIEWPQRLSWLLPEDTMKIELEHVSENQRKIIYSESCV